MSLFGTLIKLARAQTATALAGLITLAGLATLAVAGSVPPASAGPAQTKTLDLSALHAATEYRTDAPPGRGFLGSEAPALVRSLTRLNKALGTDLRPDVRLAQIAEWIYGQFGPAPHFPAQNELDLLTSRLGLPEPLPHLLMTTARDAPRLYTVVAARLARVFKLNEYTHIGGLAERIRGGVLVIIVLSRRHLAMSPVPVMLPGPAPLPLEGRLAAGYARPRLAHTLPSGETRIEALGPGPEFSVRVDLVETGRHRLEILARRPEGPNVIANFPVYVGVPVDETVAAAAPAPKRAVTPDEAQQRLLELINADRSGASLDVLAFDPELAAVALRHSEDMQANDFVGHVSPTTGGSEERLLGAGIATDLATECVGRGYSPADIHNGFMNSPGHRAAILLPGATHAGIGVAAKKQGDRTTYLVTEVFIRRIPPLGVDAKAVFRAELNGLRGSAGATALEEDAELARIADEAAREFLDDHTLSQGDVLERLNRRLKQGLKQAVEDAGSVTAVMSVVGSLKEGAERAAADPSVATSKRLGIGIAQGTRPGLVPNSIVLVLIVRSNGVGPQQ